MAIAASHRSEPEYEAGRGQPANSQTTALVREESHSDWESAPFNCINCGSKEPPEVFLENCQDLYLAKPFKADYFRCAQCGLVQLAPVPKDLSIFYEGYPVHQRKSWFYEWTRRIVMGPAYFDLGLAPPGGVLLDYGCGDGWFLDLCRKRNVKALGFEPTVPLAQSLCRRLNLPVYSDAESLMSDFQGALDIVTMHFVIEHLGNVQEAFLRITQLLKIGGLFFFTVPNVDSWEARLFGKRWHGLDPPRHISFPNRLVVEDLATRHGLKVFRTQAVPFPNGFAGSIPAVVLGRFSFALYLTMLPLGVILSRLAPTGTSAYWLQKSEN